MDLRVIYNPEAGMSERIREFRQHLGDTHECERCRTEAPGDAARYARAAVKEGVRRIVVAGGDGTVAEVVGALASDAGEVEVAVLPLGTGNDLARALGLELDDFDTACEQALGAEVRDIDVIRVTTGGQTSHCVNVANGGIGGEATIELSAESKQRWGALAYWMQAVSRVIDHRVYEIRLRGDGRTIETKACGVVIANGMYVGGGFPIAPAARLDDGLLDVVVVPDLSRLELMAEGLNAVLGRPQEDDPALCLQVRRVELWSEPPMPFSIDGEPLTAERITFEVIPRAVRMVVG